MDERAKIFPRNLTARAAYRVEGNPANSRPESALDTSSPGLEVDVRNLEQRFFPGLVFEFQRFDGAILSALELTPEQRASGLTESDCFGANRLYLWAMYGRSDPDGEPEFHGFNGLYGMKVWRRIRDLAPGRVAIVFGPTPGKNSNFQSPEALPLLAAAFDATDAAQRFVVKTGCVGRHPVCPVRGRPRGLPGSARRSRPRSIWPGRTYQNYLRALDLRFSRLRLFLLVG